MNKLIFSPSLMCADPLNLESEINLLLNNKFWHYHIDIADMHFVNNVIFGINTVNGLERFPIVKSIHLMVTQPSRIIPALKLSKFVDTITFHVESNEDPDYVIHMIRSLHYKVGMAINPETPIAALQDYLSRIDSVTIMCVKPGFAGQQFIPSSYNKARTLIQQIENLKASNIDICVDGSIGKHEITTFLNIGANEFVLGTRALFGKDLKERIFEFNSHFGQLQNS